MDDLTAIADIKKAKAATQKINLKGLFAHNDDPNANHGLNQIDEENSPVSSQP